MTEDTKFVAYVDGIDQELPVEFDNPIIAKEMVGREGKARMRLEDHLLELNIEGFDNPIIARVRLEKVERNEGFWEKYGKSDTAIVAFKDRGDLIGLHVEPVITE